MRKIDGLFSSTYRLQLHKGFQFRDIVSLLDYLDDLGITHLYLSPILEAQNGSQHGYDGINPEKISLERGGEKQWRQLMKKWETRLPKAQKPSQRTKPTKNPIKNLTNLRGVILDIVPNHLATHFENPTWRDLLEKGNLSPYWENYDLYESKILLPALGSPLEEVLSKKELHLVWHESHGFLLKYYEHLFPINISSYEIILTKINLSHLDILITKHRGHKKQIINALKKHLKKYKIQKQLKELDQDFFHTLLENQHYTLEYWRTGVKKINYRRFFDIIELIGVKIENPEGFKMVHKKILELMEQFPLLQGLRIDHIDGLLKPKDYLYELKKHTEAIWVEKILSEGELLPSEWPVLGTTGYDFSSMVTRLFANDKGLQIIHDNYLEHIEGHWRFFEDCVYESKKEILHQLFDSEFSRLCELFFKYIQKNIPEFPYELELIRKTLQELTVCLKVYRLYYQDDDPLTHPDQSNQRWLWEACDEAKLRYHASTSQKKNSQDLPFDWLAHFLVENPRHDEEKKQLLGRWQQLSGAIMAKGFEDTALYRYIPLLSLNSIGGQPDWNYCTVMEFHAFNEDRLKNHPLSMNCTTTHDTKRNEDVRSRIHVLSEAPAQWLKKFALWHSWNLPYSSSKNIPRHMEYFIYQSLLGVWPLNGEIDRDFKKRIHNYFIKAARESKMITSWLKIDEEYEKNLLTFIEEILNPRQNHAFLKSFEEFSEFTAYFGAFNSLSELTLKVLSPGIPDTYQGTEVWSYHLVDPDNRLAVDFKTLKKYSHKAQLLEKQEKTLWTDSLRQNWKTGEIKYLLLRELLKLRNAHPLVFEKGRYLPLETSHKKTLSVLGFARVWEHQWIIVLVSRHLASNLSLESALEIPDNYWQDSTLQLPLNVPTNWTNIFTGAELTLSPKGRELPLCEIFQKWPMAVLKGDSSLQRI